MLLIAKIKELENIFVQKDLSTLSFDEWLKLMNVFRHCVDVSLNTFQITHKAACQYAFTLTKKQLNHFNHFVLIGYPLWIWSHILTKIIFKSDLIHIINKDKSRELLYFAQIFHHPTSIHSALIQPKANHLKLMFESLIYNLYGMPSDHSLFYKWRLFEQQFKQLMPIKVLDDIYAFLFLPKGLVKNFQMQLITNRTLNIQTQTIHIFPMKHSNHTFKPIQQLPIEYEALVNYLLYKHAYTLLDVFTSVKPLPYQVLSNICKQLNSNDLSDLMDHIMPFAITKTQYQELMFLRQMNSRGNKTLHFVQRQYWIDYCETIYHQNLKRMSKRQYQIDYLCHHPVGLRSFENMLSYFKLSVPNPSQWLFTIEINKDMFNIHRIESIHHNMRSIAGKNLFANQVINQIFSASINQDCFIEALKNHYKKRIKNMIQKHDKPKTFLGIDWFSHNQSNKQLQSLISAILDICKLMEHELDFTLMISYMRYTIEKQSWSSCKTISSLFTEVTEIDLDCCLDSRLAK